MINWKRFIAVWPLTALGGTILLFVLMNIHLLITGDEPLYTMEDLEIVPYFLGVTAACSAPAWIILIVLGIVSNRKAAFDKTRKNLLLAHLFLGGLTFVVLMSLGYGVIAFFLILGAVFIGLGQLLLYHWGLKPKTLP
ncbi:hypothetical protein SAMN04490243_0648 [Robiginitalea myxolifaciens]|uniref:Uncharacterized protein n=1 Tax=Robiginitalea myxolifaciens TaxID=400055 RepID=A0A1I6FTR7_9FLAO|nr:hypothetical protein [Robiginitalea myxolifaciens]SFR33294.1 hypothetical protein SAMN04490243_0648 [Robiginitalea myxolifaciens]